MTNPFFITKIKRTSGKTGTAMTYIPKNVVDYLKLHLNDKVFIKIKKAETDDVICKCLDCEKTSLSKTNDVFCKNCGSENLEIISEDVEDIIKRGLEK